ncbi:hypothetical protein C7I85_22640 [Mesorhizobium soli]|uniref:Uncharacterized protein n=1 Tax=Pseudaminobacter soli (ex Li et al. 2025) TaxID=1295366 RepID=A0A2P7S4J7_9HYPH|nr:hypothetical protein C7I85_22640 [Mesorhizobium soli]
MTGADHQHTAAVDLAAEWLSTTRRDQISGPLVPALRQRFGLSAQEACQAIAQANLRRARAG